MAYSNKPEETLAEKIGPWLDKAMEHAKEYEEETDLLRRAHLLTMAISSLHFAVDRCMTPFTFLLAESE